MYKIRSFYKSNKSRVILYHQATQTRFLLEFFLILNLYRENIRPISPLNRSRELSFSLLPPCPSLSWFCRNDGGIIQILNNSRHVSMYNPTSGYRGN